MSLKLLRGVRRNAAHCRSAKCTSFPCAFGTLGAAFRVSYAAVARSSDGHHFAAEVPVASASWLQ